MPPLLISLCLTFLRLPWECRQDLPWLYSLQSHQTQQVKGNQVLSASSFCTSLFRRDGWGLAEVHKRRGETWPLPPCFFPRHPFKLAAPMTSSQSPHHPQILLWVQFTITACARMMPAPSCISHEPRREWGEFSSGASFVSCLGENNLFQKYFF